MIETKCYCDHCKNEVESIEDLTKVWLSIKLDETRGPDFKLELCNGCMGELGFQELTSSNYISNYTHAQRNIFTIVKSLFGKKS